MEKKCHADIDQKKARIDILISGKFNFGKRKIMRKIKGITY